MRIRGYWGEHDAPHLRARLICPDLRINKLLVFLMDTGASRTVFMGRDVVRLGVSYDPLTPLPHGTVASAASCHRAAGQGQGREVSSVMTSMLGDSLAISWRFAGPGDSGLSQA